jgi:hypothetical protein
VGESGICINPAMTGMKYENVKVRSRSASAVAVNHQLRTSPSARQAVTAFASVTIVSGTVVTKIQNRIPVLFRRAASAFQRSTDSDELSHSDVTMRLS